MRIISGKAKGRKLASFKGSHIRPVLDQVKESIFNILFDVQGKTVLDIFAGTGSIGLEAVSRGAASALFVDKDKDALGIITKNIEKCDFVQECKIMARPADRAVKQLGNADEKFDLIFIDPPYLKDLLKTTLRLVIENDLLEKDGTIIMEHHPKEPVGKLPDGWKVSDERTYGQTLISFISYESQIQL